MTIIQSESALGLNYLFIGASALSAASSLSVVLTYLLFVKTMGKKLFMQLIAIISSCELMGNIAGSWGFPRRGSLECKVQAFLLTFFFRASWLWTTVLMYQIHSVVIHRTIGLSALRMHLLCWFTTLLFAFLPLTTSNYGITEELDGTVACFLDRLDPIDIFWYFVSYPGILFTCVILMIYYQYKISCRLSDELPTTLILRKAVDSLKFYPTALMVVWIPLFIVAYLYSAVPSFPATVYVCFLLLSTQSGTLMAIIFFIKSKEARWRWRKLLGMEFLSTQVSDFAEMREYVDVSGVHSCEKGLRKDESEGASTLQSALLSQEELQNPCRQSSENMDFSYEYRSGSISQSILDDISGNHLDERI